MKIALLGPSEYVIKSQTENFVQEYTYALVTELVRKGYEVTFFGQYGSKLPCEVFSLNLDSIDWSYDHEVSSEVKSYAEIQHAYFEIFKYLQESNFDLIHNLSDQQIPVFTAQFLNIPTVTTLFNKPNGLLQSSVKLNQTQKNYYIAINHEIAHSWSGHSKIDDIVYNGINYNDWVYNASAETNTVILLHDINHQSGIENIIEAVKQSGFQLKIYGDLKDEDYYQNKLKPLFNKNISYIGEASKSNYQEELQKATIAVISKELFDRKSHFVLESLSSGTPVTILADTMNTDYLPDKCGVQVKSDNEQVLRNALISTTRKSRQACRDYVIDNFNFDKMVEEYIAFYHKVLAVEVASLEN
ncbi:glycosyltransferase [Mesonia aestuariivivens]|uniref:Glycosyltransferase n=1 Tax=Mesonia aestuariivivens TaxID=2796128 RepID=A0ABS6W5H5_9FLAO|nr:glycosyltransferase [Mesonia aestuariivivens]MBW2962383.1 glycosyltransferase [Mesonia aestuariivivens]